MTLPGFDFFQTGQSQFQLNQCVFRLACLISQILHNTALKANGVMQSIKELIVVAHQLGRRLGSGRIAPSCLGISRVMLKLVQLTLGGHNMQLNTSEILRSQLPRTHGSFNCEHDTFYCRHLFS